MHVHGSEHDVPAKLPPPRHAKEWRLLDNDNEYSAFHALSLADPSTFWGDIAQRDFLWGRKPSADSVLNLDWSFEEANYRWFDGATSNITINALDRHVHGGYGDASAITWESDDGATVRYTFRQVLEHVSAVCQVLEAHGVKRGDRVSLVMPMVPQLAFCMLACARMGAVHSIVFAGFSAEAVASRMVDARSDVVITADGGLRGGKTVQLKSIVDRACEIAAGRGCPVRRVLVTHRAGAGVHEGAPGWVAGRDVSLDAAVEEVRRNTIGRLLPLTYAPQQMGAEDPLFILYTSGSTGTSHVTTEAAYATAIGSDWYRRFDD